MFWMSREGSGHVGDISPVHLTKDVPEAAGQKLPEYGQRY